MNWILNKTVIVTGASSGIGQNICCVLAKKYNCKIIGIARNIEKLRATGKLIKNINGEFTPYQLDVSSENGWIELKNYLENNNIQIDVLINCAGTMPPFECGKDIEKETFERIFAVNFFSATYAVRQLFPLIIKSKTPAILNISSISGLGVFPGTSAYSASKSALKTYSEILHSELKGKVFVSTVLPGFVKTNLFSSKDNVKDVICEQDKSFVNKFSMPAEKMAKKIVKVLARKKSRAIIGIDAKLINFLSKIMPQKTGNLLMKIMKKSGLKSFADIFENDKRDNQFD
ncbi:MAG: SDR family NAD(P)-dependent oxidoreductase [Christensenellales bacterium]